MFVIARFKYYVAYYFIVVITITTINSPQGARNESENKT